MGTWNWVKVKLTIWFLLGRVLFLIWRSNIFYTQYFVWLDTGRNEERAWFGFNLDFFLIEWIKTESLFILFSLVVFRDWIRKKEVWFGLCRLSHPVISLSASFHLHSILNFNIRGRDGLRKRIWKWTHGLRLDPKYETEIELWNVIEFQRETEHATLSSTNCLYLWILSWWCNEISCLINPEINCWLDVCKIKLRVQLDSGSLKHVFFFNKMKPIVLNYCTIIVCAAPACYTGSS